MNNQSLLSLKKWNGTFSKSPYQLLFTINKADPVANPEDNPKEITLVLERLSLLERNLFI
jgi:hypothetical protein